MPISTSKSIIEKSDKRWCMRDFAHTRFPLFSSSLFLFAYLYCMYICVRACVFNLSLLVIYTHSNLFFPLVASTLIRHIICPRQRKRKCTRDLLITYIINFTDPRVTLYKRHNLCKYCKIFSTNLYATWRGYKETTTFWKDIDSSEEFSRNISRVHLLVSRFIEIFSSSQVCG